MNTVMCCAEIICSYRAKQINFFTLACFKIYLDYMEFEIFPSYLDCQVLSSGCIIVCWSAKENEIKISGDVASPCAHSDATNCQ